MNKKTYKIGLLFCLSVFIFLTGLVVFDKYNEKQEDVPVVAITPTPDQTETKTNEKISYPYTGDIKVARTFYDQSADSASQQNSLVLFEGVYRPNQGTDFSNNNQTFEVMACLSGKVTVKKEDPIFGLMVSIESDDGVTITYQSLSDVSVELNSEVKQGDIIAKSGENLYEADLGNHLHLIIEKNGNVLNPEKCFDKETSEL